MFAPQHAHCSGSFTRRCTRLAILNGLLGKAPATQSPLHEPASAAPASTHRVWPRVLAIILFFAAFEGILFHTGLYSSIVEPDSTTGFMELQIRNEIRRPKPDRNQVLAVGHSRMALLPRVVNQEKPGTGYTFATIGLGGTTPRDLVLRASRRRSHSPQLCRDRDSHRRLQRARYLRLPV